MIANSFYIEQFGCPSNRADGNKIASFLIANGWQSEKPEKADIVIVMSCGFSLFHQEESSDGALALKNQMKPEAELWIGGCLPEINPNSMKRISPHQTFGPRNLISINKLVDNSISIEKYYSKQSISEITKLPSDVFLLRIATGCKDRCSYCQIWKATGNVRSRSIPKLVEEAKIAADSGITVFHIVGEDMGCYGEDIGTSIFELLDKLNANLPFCKFFLASIHPRYFIQNVEKFAEMFNLSSVGKRVSLPLQSGSNRILSLMKRRHTVEAYYESIQMFHKMCHDSELATDLIVGFPTETEEDFEETRKVLSKIYFHYIDCFRYDSHPSAPSTHLYNQIPEDVKNQRHRILSMDIVRQYLYKNGIWNIDQFQKFISDPTKKIPLNTNVSFVT